MQVRWRELVLSLAVICWPLKAWAVGLDAEANSVFLQHNRTIHGVILRPSGLQYRILRNGVGRHTNNTLTAQVAYRARLIDGEVFDGTSPDLPANLYVPNLIAGLGEALQLMQEGDRWEIVVPPALAFGTGPRTDKNPLSGQTIIFDLTLLAVGLPSASAPATNGEFSYSAGPGGASIGFSIHPDQ